MWPIPKWNDGYSINNETIDTQHKELFRLIAYAHGLDADISKADLKKIFLALFDYAKNHFKDEEAYMDSIGYPKLEEHKKMHVDFVNHISNALEGYGAVLEDSNSLDIVKKDLLIWIQNWLVRHILREDLSIEAWRISSIEK